MIQPLLTLSKKDLYKSLWSPVFLPLQESLLARVPTFARVFARLCSYLCKSLCSPLFLPLQESCLARVPTFARVFARPCSYLCNPAEHKVVVVVYDNVLSTFIVITIRVWIILTRLSRFVQSFPLYSQRILGLQNKGSQFKKKCAMANRFFLNKINSFEFSLHAMLANCISSSKVNWQLDVIETWHYYPLKILSFNFLLLQQTTI